MLFHSASEPAPWRVELGLVFGRSTVRGTAWVRHVLQLFAMVFAVAFATGFASGSARAATPAVVAGNSHSMLLKTDGSLWAWGRNDLGQLGDGSGVHRAQPVLVAQLGGGVVAIAAGGESSFALTSDGALWAWGGNALGQLGDGTLQNRLAPVRVGAGFKSLTSNGSSTFAMRTDGTAWAWGKNESGQLGDASKLARNVPVRVVAEYASASQGVCHGAGVTSGGSLWTWGCSSYYVGGTAGHFILGQRGNGHMNTNSYNDVDPPDFAPAVLGEGYVSVSTGEHYNLALKADGSLWAFGTGDFRDVAGPKSLVPVRVGDGFLAAAQGQHFTVAIKTDGSLQTWGINDAGQLGDAGAAGTACLYGEVFTSTIACRTVPLAINTGQGGGSGKAYRALAAGGRHAVALRADGTVWSWGGNDFGQVGDGSTINRNGLAQLALNVGSPVPGPRVRRAVPASQADALAATPIFEPDYYLLRNNDVARAFGSDKAAVRTHWLTYGSGEQREGSVLFDSLWYLQHHQDLADAFGGDAVLAAVHFKDWGLAEGRDASPAFSLAVYKASHPDLQAAFGNDHAAYLRHFTQYGAGECRKASNHFDARFYLAQHKDVMLAVNNDCAGALIHWLNNGRAEGRQAVPQQAPLYPR